MAAVTAAAAAVVAAAAAAAAMAAVAAVAETAEASRISCSVSVRSDERHARRQQVHGYQTWIADPIAFCDALDAFDESTSDVVRESNIRMA